MTTTTTTTNPPTAPPGWKTSCADEAAATLVASHPELLTPGACPSAGLVKQNALRQVYRIECNGAAYYVKRHVARGSLARLKWLLLGRPADNEYRTACYARKHGVPAVNICACAAGHSASGERVSISLSAACEPAEVLTDTFARVGEVRSLTEATADLLATAHNAAFLHPDGHPGNILVQHDREQWTCRYVDVYGARCGGEVTDRDAARNLAALNQWFELRTTRMTRLRFLKHYCRIRGIAEDRPALRRFAQLVLEASRRHAHRLYAKRDRRIGRDNAHFARFETTAGYKVAATCRYRTSAAQLGWKSQKIDRQTWRRAFAAHPAEGTADLDPPSALADAESETFFPPGRITARWWQLSATPAWRRYWTACTAHNRDLPVALGLACSVQQDAWSNTKRSDWWRYRPADGVPLSRYIESADPSDRHRALEAVGRLIADTAQRGLAVRNIAVSRIDILPAPPDANAPPTRTAPIAYWVGIEGETLGRPAPPHVVVWMLTHLAAGAAEANRLNIIDQARVVRACWRRQGPSTRQRNWRHLWQDASRAIQDYPIS